MQPSPYTPGEVARDVPGRAVQLAQMDERLSYMIDLQRLIGRVRVDVAARGIGKTSLLRQMQRRADSRGALTVWVTAGEDRGLVVALAEEIDRRTSGWKGDARRRLRQSLNHLQVTIGVPGVAQLKATPSREQAAVPTIPGVREFEDVVRHTVATARKENRPAVVFFVDEIQSADADGLRTLAYAWQHLQSEGSDVPAAVFAAGLPNSPEVIAAVVTFSERFAYRPLDRLDDDAAMVALAGPARALGVHWEADALDQAVAIAQGYPYSLQLLGDAAWNAAGYPEAGATLAIAHVRQARATMQIDLDALFRARWEKSTPAEQDFMRAIATLGDGPVQRADIARHLNATTEDLSVPRARLLDKGLIEAAGHGKLEFTIPGFADYVRRHVSGTAEAQGRPQPPPSLPGERG